MPHAPQRPRPKYAAHALREAVTALMRGWTY